MGKMSGLYVFVFAKSSMKTQLEEKIGDCVLFNLGSTTGAFASNIEQITQIAKHRRHFDIVVTYPEFKGWLENVCENLGISFDHLVMVSENQNSPDFCQLEDLCTRIREVYLDFSSH